MRIAIVNDSLMAMEALRRVVGAEPGWSLAWTALDGESAVAQCARDRPDLVLMDIFMPGIGGVEATRRIMAATPCPILVVTANVQSATSPTCEALAAGALDVVATPVLGQGSGAGPGADPLRRKIGQLARILPPPRSTPAVVGPGAGSLLVIGASSGGPAVVARLLRELAAPLPVACVVIQHLNPEFAPGMASWLGSETGHPVQVAIAGTAPAAGQVYLSGRPGHLVLEQGQFAYRAEPVDYPYQPSIDEFFASACAWPRPSVALLLTGMGRDGARGLGALRKRGWTTIAQEPASCAISAMPQAAIDGGAAQMVMHPERMSATVQALLKKATSP